MKRRNVDSVKLRRNFKRSRISDGLCSSALLYIKFLLVWAFVMTADFLLEFRFEFLWPFWLLLRSVYDSCRYQGLAFSVFFVFVAITSDMVCFLFIPIQWLFFLASTYVWVQYVWHTDRGVCLPTVCLWCLFLYIEAAVRMKELKNMPFTLDLCRPFAAHCVGYPVVTLGFGVKSYVGFKYKLRRQREVAKENDFYMQLLQDALPVEHRSVDDGLKALPYKLADDVRISNGALTQVPTPNQISSSTSLSTAEAAASSLKRPALQLSDRGYQGTIVNHRKRNAVLHRQFSPTSCATLNGRSNNYQNAASTSGGISASLTKNDQDYSMSPDKNFTWFGWLLSLLSAKVDDEASDSAAIALDKAYGTSSNQCSSYADNNTDDESSSSGEDLAASGSNFSFGECFIRRLTGWPVKDGTTPPAMNPSSSETSLPSSAVNGVATNSIANYPQKSSKLSASSRTKSESGRRRGCVFDNSTPCGAGSDSPNSQQHLISTKDQSQARNVSILSELDSAKEKVQNKDLALSLESDVEKLKSDLRASLSVEAELRQQLHGLTQGDKSVKNELQQLRQNNEQLQAKLHNLVRARQQDKQTISSFEKRFAEENKLRLQAESSLQQERKVKKAEEAAAGRTLAAVGSSSTTTTTRIECGEACRTHKRDLDLELKTLKRDLRQREDYQRQLESELHSLRQYKETHDADVLMSALSAMQDKNAHLENSLSAETRIKLDLFSALGEAKRQLEITQNHLQKREKENEELREQYNEILRNRRGNSPMTPPVMTQHPLDHIAPAPQFGLHQYRANPLYNDVGHPAGEYNMQANLMSPEMNNGMVGYLAPHSTNTM